MAELSNGSITIRFRNGDHIPPNACKCYAASISHVRLLLLTLLVTLLVTLPACCLLPSFLPSFAYRTAAALGCILYRTIRS